MITPVLWSNCEFSHSAEICFPDLNSEITAMKHYGNHVMSH